MGIIVQIVLALLLAAVVRGAVFGLWFSESQMIDLGWDKEDRQFNTVLLTLGIIITAILLVFFPQTMFTIIVSVLVFFAVGRYSVKLSRDVQTYVENAKRKRE